MKLKFNLKKVEAVQAEVAEAEQRAITIHETHEAELEALHADVERVKAEREQQLPMVTYAKPEESRKNQS